MPRQAIVTATTILVVAQERPDNVIEKAADQLLVSLSQGAVSNGVPSATATKNREKTPTFAVIPATVVHKENNAQVLEAYHTTEEKG